MTAQSNFPMNDLILRLTGGQRDGELISVNTTKCLLGMDENQDGVAGNPQCAILRGPNGAAIRSYGDEVLVNGAATTVHWLNEGDLIEFPNLMTVEIAQLGWVEEPCQEFGSVARELSLAEPPETESFVTLGNEEPLADDSSNQETEEKIIGYDERESDTTPIEPSAMNLGIKDAIPELSGTSQEEINSRLLEMERVFGSQLAQPETEHEPEAPSAESSTAESFVSQPANEQSAETFETLPHSQDENVASFADNSPSEDPLPLDNVEPSSDSSLPSQLVGELEEVASVEETVAEPSPTVSTEPPRNETVSELLARMKAEGQWDGIPGEEQDVQPIESTAPMDPEPDAEVIAENPIAGAPGEEEVDDYMSQLLSRMRGDTPTNRPKPVQVTVKNKPSGGDDPEEEVFVPPANPLKAEEFKPARKAQKIGSLSAMRELANSSARSAVKKSENTRRKALGYAQVGIALASFVMAAYYLLVSSVVLFDSGFIVGVVCLSIAGFLCYRFYLTMKHNEMVQAKPNSKDQDTPEDDTQAVPEA